MYLWHTLSCELKPFLLPLPCDIDKAVPSPTLPPLPHDNDNDSAWWSNACPSLSTWRNEHAGHQWQLFVHWHQDNSNTILQHWSPLAQCTSTGFKVSEWPVPDTNSYSCIPLPKHEQFLAFSAKRTVTFWDPSMHNWLLLTLEHPQDIHSIVFSPNDWILAIGGGRKITIQSLSGINVSAMVCCAISLNSFLASASSPSVSLTSYILWTRHSHQWH